MTPEEQENADLNTALALVQKHFQNVCIVYSNQKQHGYIVSEHAHITQTLGAVAHAQHDMIQSVNVTSRVGTPQA